MASFTDIDTFHSISSLVCSMLAGSHDVRECRSGLRRKNCLSVYLVDSVSCFCFGMKISRLPYLIFLMRCCCALFLSHVASLLLLTRDDVWTSATSRVESRSSHNKCLPSFRRLRARRSLCHFFHLDHPCAYNTKTLWRCAEPRTDIEALPASLPRTPVLVPGTTPGASPQHRRYGARQTFRLPHVANVVSTPS